MLQSYRQVYSQNRIVTVQEIGGTMLSDITMEKRKEEDYENSDHL